MKALVFCVKTGVFTSCGVFVTLIAMLIQKAEHYNNDDMFINTNFTHRFSMPIT